MTMRTFRVLDTRGEYLTEVESDCLENADYTAQAMGYEVLDYYDPDALIARPAIPRPMSFAEYRAYCDSLAERDED